MVLNVNHVKARREYPNWNLRGKIKKVDQEGNLVEGQHAFGGEVIRISPRFQKNGANFRVRPERPSVFFAAFCVENNLLPIALTPEECESPAGLEILQPLWDTHCGCFPKLESPFAACDESTVPSLKDGFSFCIVQVLVEEIGVVRSTPNRPTLRPAVNGSANTDLFAAIRTKIEEMRSRNATPELQPPATPKKKS
jgi:hypothetical protein